MYCNPRGIGNPTGRLAHEFAKPPSDGYIRSIVTLTFWLAVPRLAVPDMLIEIGNPVASSTEKTIGPSNFIPGMFVGVAWMTAACLPETDFTWTSL